VSFFERFVDLVEKHGFVVIQALYTDVERVRCAYDCIISNRVASVAEWDAKCRHCGSYKDFMELYMSLLFALEGKQKKRGRRGRKKDLTEEKPTVVPRTTVTPSETIEAADELLRSMITQFGISAEWYIAFSAHFMKLAFPLLMAEAGSTPDADITRLSPEDAASKLYERLKAVVKMAKEYRAYLEERAQMEQELARLRELVERLQAEVVVRDRLIEQMAETMAQVHEEYVKVVMEIGQALKGRKALAYLIAAAPGRD